jgi:hypothetical protein
MTSTAPHIDPLPPDAVLVHIGMHKTGTTALQSLLAGNRDALGEHGVTYPGDREAHHVHARSLTQFDVGWQGENPAPPPHVWADLAADVTQTPGRVVLSSEFFSAARGDQPDRLVDDLGRARVHILLGVRAMSAVAVSAWQQTLKQGRLADVGQWAARNLPRDGRPPRNRTFWEQWDLGAQARRWVQAAGADRVTIVAVDARDRQLLPGTVEALLGLPPGLLSAQQPAKTNRGMTAVEAELVRQVNEAVRDKIDWPQYRDIVRLGVIRTLVESRTPAPDEPKPALPPWAVAELEQAGRRAVEEIGATGARIVGRLEALAETETETAGSAAGSARGPVTTVPIDVGVRAVVGAVAAATALTQAAAARPAGGRTTGVGAGAVAPETAVGRIPSRVLATTLARRLSRRAAGTVRRAAGVVRRHR